MAKPTTAAALAEQAAEAVRALNHATLRVPGARMRYPGDAYTVIGNLSELAMRLPQALTQLQRFIDELEAAGHLRHDTGDPRRLTRALDGLHTSTDDAVRAARHLYRALEAAHGALGSLAYEADPAGGDRR